MIDYEEIKEKLYFDGREYDERYAEETQRIEDDDALEILSKFNYEETIDNNGVPKTIKGEDTDRQFTRTTNPPKYDVKEIGFASAEEAAKHFAERYNTFTLKTVGDLTLEYKQYGLELGSIIYQRTDSKRYFYTINVRQ